MKNKKLLAAIVAVTMSATAAASFTACKTDEHTHTYTDWTVTTPATCTTEGIETGTCKDDGATDTRTIPALGHKYGDWNVTKEPTSTEKGSATKACANDSAKEHPITIDLPVLTDSAYKVDVIKDTPTYKDAKYTYSPAEGGSIVLTAHEDKKNVTLNVSQAIETANDAKYIALVGKGEGTYYNKAYREWDHQTIETSQELLYEYGDNYTHINDGAVNNMEYWGDKDAEGKVSGVIYKDGRYSWIDEETADYYNGMYFAGPAGIHEKSYQYIEGLLDALYEAATAPVYYNNEFTESVEGSTYKFSWTLLDQSKDFEMNDDETDYEILNIHTNIKHISVEFTLDASYMLNSFKLHAEQYLTAMYTYTEANKATKPLAFTYDSELEVFIPNADATGLSFDYDATTKTYTPKAGAEPETINEITVTQTALKDIDKLPVNEFKHDEVAVSSFTLMQNLGKGWYKEVTEEEWNAIDDDDPAYVKKTELRSMGFEYDYTAYLLYKRIENGCTVTGTTAEDTLLDVDEVLPESAYKYLDLNPARAYLIKDGKEILIYSSDYEEQEEKVPEEYDMSKNYELAMQNLQVSIYVETDWLEDEQISVYKSAQITIRSRQKTGDFNIKIAFGEASSTFTYHVDAAMPEYVSTDVNVYNEAVNDYIVDTSTTANVYVGQPLAFVAKGNGWEDYLVDSRAEATLADGTENATLTATEKGYSFVATEAGEYTINVVSLADDTLTNTLTITVEAAPTVELVGTYDAGDYSVIISDTTVTVNKNSDKVAEFGYTYENGTLTAVSDNGKYKLVLTENYKLALASEDQFGEDGWDVLTAPVSAGVKALKAELAGTTWSGETTDGTTITVIFSDEEQTVMFADAKGSSGGMVFGLGYQITENGTDTYSITFDYMSASDYYDNWCNYGLAATGNTITVTGNSISDFKLSVFDVSDESNPELVTVTELSYDD